MKNRKSHIAEHFPSLISPQISIGQIDLILSNTPERFAQVARDLVEFIRKQGSKVDVLSFRASRMASEHAVNPTQEQIALDRTRRSAAKGVLQMDAEEELTMARCYEFLVLRVQVEIERLGVVGAQAAVLCKCPEREIMAAMAAFADTSYLCQCILELHQLRNLYIESVMHCVDAVVSRYSSLGVDSQDLKQEGIASLFCAIDGFDWRRKLRFRTYAQFWIRQAVLGALYCSSRTVRVPTWVQKVLARIWRLQDQASAHGIVLSNLDIALELGVTKKQIETVLSSKRYSVSLDTSAGTRSGRTIGHLLPDRLQLPVPSLVAEGDLRTSLAVAMKGLPGRERSILERRFGLGDSGSETLAEIAESLKITPERVRQIEQVALARLKRPSVMKQLGAFISPM